jgi:two-component system phosphate regulon response regulator PhoB
MQRVLIVDDDPDIQRLVSYNFAQAGFEVTTAASGRTALESIQRHPPDLVILDVMLPDIDGMEVCRTLRQREKTLHIPIVMLTARGEEIDRVAGLELGADDYVSKPFSTRELLLRVKSIFRRMKAHPNVMLQSGGIRLYPDRRQCIVSGRPVTLTAKEFDLLEQLMRARGNVLRREVLMDKVWEYHGEATSRTLDQHVKRLREKLGEHGSYVETVRGVGYRMGASEES